MSASFHFSPFVCIFIVGIMSLQTELELCCGINMIRNANICLKRLCQRTPLEIRNFSFFFLNITIILIECVRVYVCLLKHPYIIRIWNSNKHFQSRCANLYSILNSIYRRNIYGNNNESLCFAYLFHRVGLNVIRFKWTVQLLCPTILCDVAYTQINNW